MGVSKGLRSRLTIKTVESVRQRLWPDFFEEHGCVFVGCQASKGDINPPPQNDTLTGWELFVNHTHIFDEFKSSAYAEVIVAAHDGFREVEPRYEKENPEFLLSKEIGEVMALTWATKLKQDFPDYRFRVYYLYFDTACLRFHRVRQTESVWLTDEQFKTGSEPYFEDGILYDTDYLSRLVRNTASRVVLIQ